MKITVEIKTIYGKTTIYPACTQSQLFARIAGTRTLTEHALKLIAALGYEIETVQTMLSVSSSNVTVVDYL